MKLGEIKRIKQTADQIEVNQYLSDGYEIIKIISGKVTQDNYETIQPVYILGWKDGI